MDDEDPPALTLSASAMEVNEGESFTLTLTMSPKYQRLSSVSVSYQGPMGAISNTTPLGYTFAGGQPVQRKTIQTVDDDVYTGDQEVTFTIVTPPPSPFTVGTQSSVTVIIKDDEQPNVDATGKPAITGAATEGELLTAGAGTIADENGLDDVVYTYQWQRRDGATWSDITGATASAYYLSAADIGKPIRVVVDFDDDDRYPESRTSDATSAVQDSQTRTVPWSATITVGLDANTHGYLPSSAGALSPDQFTAASTTYTVAGLGWDSDDLAVKLALDAALSGSFELLVSNLADALESGEASFSLNVYSWGASTNPGWNDGDTFAVALAIPVNVDASGLTVTGTYQTGQSLTADTSGITDANGLTSPTYTYKWERVSCDDSADDGVLSGETNASYSVVDDDLDCNLKVTVTFKDDDDFSETLTQNISPRGGITSIAITSDPGSDEFYAEDDVIEVSVTYNEAMNVTGAPQLELDVGGTPRQAGYDSGRSSATVLKFRYQVGDTDLDLDGVSVDANKLTLNGGSINTRAAPVEPGSLLNPALADDSGHRVDGVPPTLSSATVSADGQKVTLIFDDIGLADTSRGEARFTLTRDDGSTVTASSAVVHTDQIDLEQLTPRIQRDWVLKLSYRATTPGDEAGAVRDSRGNHLRAITDFSVTNNSDWVPNVDPTGAPVINGTVQQGETLTVDTSSIADENGLGTFSYQWSRISCSDSNDDGDISGATSTTYIVVAADLDCVLKFTVSYTDGDNYDESLSDLTLDLTLATWSLSRSSSSVTEGGTVTLTLRITNSHTYTSPVTAAVYYGDTPVADGGLLAGQGGTHTITVPAGQTQGSVTLTARDDDLYNYATGSTRVQLTARVGLTDLGNAAQLTIRDNESRPSITLSATTDRVEATRVIEGDSIILIATAQPAYAGTMTVTLSHTDASGVLTGTVPTMLEFAAEDPTTIRAIRTEDDDTEKRNARVTFTISDPSAPGRLGAPRSVSLDWVDDDGPPLIGVPPALQPLNVRSQDYVNVAGEHDNPAHGIWVHWYAVPGAAEYKLEYRKSGDTGAWTRTTIGDFDQSPSVTPNRQLMGVAAGLECGTRYDLRLSLRGQRPTYVDGFGPYLTLNNQRTGDCPKPYRITNMLTTVEPGCVTITWARPTDASWTGYRVVRSVLEGDDTLSTEVLHEQLNDSSTRFRDCTNLHGNKYGQEGSRYIYRIEYIRGPAGAFGWERGHVRSTGSLTYPGSGRPFSPRDLRLTTDTQTRRSMSWDAPPSHLLTAHRAFRGQLTTGAVADPWTTGYIVERREFIGDPENQFKREYVDGSSWETVRQGANDDTSTSYTDNTDRGIKQYVYRIRTTNPRGTSSEYTDDYLWDAPVVLFSGDPPENSEATGAPAISGTARVGQTLTADTTGIADADGLDDATFTYQWIRVDDGTDADISGETARTYELSPDDVGKTVKVRVSFTDDRFNDESLTSAATAVVAYADGPPGPPREVGVEAGDGELRVSWQAPAADDTAPVDGYRVLYRQEGGSDQEHETDGLSATIGGLTNGVAYAVRVEARNASGYGTPSEEITATPRALTPDAPENLTGEPVHHLRVALDWDDVEDADSYDVQFFDWNSQTLDVLPFAGVTITFDGSSAVVDNLPEGRFWWFLVRAVNAHGPSEWSNYIQLFPTRASDWDNSEPTGLPTITGTARVGQTLTADTSGIADPDGMDNATFTYQWIRSDNGADASIEGATSRTYVLSDDDEGKAIKVRVNFTDDAHNDESLTSDATDEVAARPNSEPTGAPTITGTAQVGQTLTADTSGIADADGMDNATFTYQWIRSDGNTDADISGETAQTYVLSDDDVGNTIKVRVTFDDDADNEESLTSAATETVSAAPIWSATMTVGVSGDRAGYSLFGPLGELSSTEFSLDGTDYVVQVIMHDGDTLYLRLDLEAAAGLALKIGDTEFAVADASVQKINDAPVYQWPRGDVSWSDGETVELALTLAADDDPQESSQNAEPTGLPAVTGTAQVGQTLTADTTGIADADGLTNATFTYQWLRSDGNTDADIDGETAQTYELSDDDQGKTIKVRITFTDDAHNDESLTSDATEEVAARPNSEPTGLPTITGTAQVGQTLTADTTGIADADGLTNATFTYQWIRSDGNTDADISGATARTYELSDADQGKTIKVRITFTDDAHNDESLTSASTEEVAARPNSEPTGLPTVTGTAQVGQTLTADTSGIADPDGMDNATFTYQWIRNDGNTDANISGETAQTYELSDADQGKAIKVRVTFTDDAHNDETLTSAATAAVAARPNRDAAGLPTVTGTAQVGQTLTADTSGIADADGLTNATFTYQWIRSDNGADANIDGATARTYELSGDDQGKAIRVRVTFTDDAHNDESLTSEATTEVAPPPLTARFESKPSAHDGQTAFTFELHFSEEFGLSYRTLRDHAFTVTGGEVTRAQRLTRGSNIGWRITVQPDGNGDVTVALPVTTDCDADGAICTADGRMLSNSLSLTASGP